MTRRQGIPSAMRAYDNARDAIRLGMHHNDTQRSTPMSLCIEGAIRAFKYRLAGYNAR